MISVFHTKSQTDWQNRMLDCDANEFFICCLKLFATRCPYNQAYAPGCDFDLSPRFAVVEVANFANCTAGLLAGEIWLLKNIF